MNDLIGRRAFLQSASIGTLAALSPTAPAAVEQNAPVGRGSLIARTQEPVNLETPGSGLQTFITPNDQFYVRNHFKQPEIAVDSWKLKIEGAVTHPFEISYRDLVGMPSRKQIAMFECAGNGRMFLIPKEGGVQWLSGAAGNAEWTGVPLAAILQKAGLKSNAVDVIFEGADHGEVKDEPKTPGDVRFARSLPVKDARMRKDVLMGDVLLAYKMNGSDLPVAHGFPLRAVVPGWYGMASVKWLTRIVVTDKPFEGFFQTMQYSHWERPNGMPTLVPVTEIKIKTSIVAPAIDEVIARDTAYKIRGLAWAGGSGIAQVEVSSDGGQKWNKAQLTGPSVRYAWRLWKYDWRPAAPGPYTLMSRGTDDQGQVQPMERSRDFRNYEIRHVVPIQVTVS